MKNNAKIMKLRWELLFIVFIILFPRYAPAQAGASIASCEKAFARSAQHVGIKKAFEQYLSPEGYIVVGHQIVNGRAFYKRVIDDLSATLWWKPQKIFVNKQEDFGFATGPFLYFEKDSEKSVSGGNTFSIWKKEPDGEFKILFDGGVSVCEWANSSVEDIDNVADSQFVLDSQISAVSGLKPDMRVVEPNQIHHQAIFLRPDKKGVLCFEQTKSYPLFSMYVCREGFDDFGGMYYRFGNVARNEQSLSQQQYCGYFVQVWLWQPKGWQLVADVMQYSE